MKQMISKLGLRAWTILSVLCITAVGCKDSHIEEAVGGGASQRVALSVSRVGYAGTGTVALSSASSTNAAANALSAVASDTAADAVASDSQTRATANGVSASFADGDRVGLFLRGDTYDDIDNRAVVYDAANGKWNISGDPILVEYEDAEVTAYYPYDDSEDFDMSAVALKPGAYDVNTNDFVWQKATANAYSPAVSFSLQHALTRVKIRLNGGNPVSDSAAYQGEGTVMALQIADNVDVDADERVICYDAAIDLTLDEPVITPGVKGSVLDMTNKSLKDGTVVYDLLLVPVSHIDAGCVMLNVVIDDRLLSSAFPIGTIDKWEAGKSYTYDVSVRNGEAQIVFGKAYTTPWNDGGTISGELFPPGPYNLSNSTGADAIENTANCYIVSKSGKYRFPLVYGNAIKNGADNTDAYNPGTVEGGLSTFVDHADEPITGPYIYDKYTPANACIVWQDAEDLVTDVDLSEDNHFITFNVETEPAGKAGNAVVAVRDAEDTVLWSWHIWVTAEDLTPKAVTNYMGEVNYMMPVNLGWVSTGTYTGYCPFYQWGRKDPFLPSDGTGNTDKTYSGTKWTCQASTTATIGTNIQNPTIHYYSSSTLGPCNTQYNNLWSAKNTKTDVAYNVADETVIKTVYDPCPAGFTVAPINAYTGFTTTGQSSSTNTEWNVQSTTFNKGYTFYCGKNKTGATIFFPAAGYRDFSSGALTYVTTLGHCWAAVPSSTTGGRNLYFDSAYVDPVNYDGRAYGYSVRPVQEK